MFKANKEAQDKITDDEDEGEAKFRKSLDRKVKKSVRKVSKEQAEINRKYALVCADIDYTREPVCTGCLRYQGGNIKLSHSHLISRSDAKAIGRPELITNPLNIQLHCLDFAGNIGCHNKWANPTLRSQLKDYESNMEFIKNEVPEMYQKYLAKT